MLSRRTPMRRVPWRRRLRDTGPTNATKAWVYVRDDGCCLRCGRVLNHGQYEHQHRLPRGLGGTSNPAVNLPANLILLGNAFACGCHGWVEDEGRRNRQSYANGWLIRRWQSPTETPVTCARRGLILLSDDGEWKAA